jgi:hypothetical protein
MGSAYLHWVVQRDARTGAPITFSSFADYQSALRHKAELEAIGDPFGRSNIVPSRAFPPVNFQNEAKDWDGAASARQPEREMENPLRSLPLNAHNDLVRPELQNNQRKNLNSGVTTNSDLSRVTPGYYADGEPG